MVFFPEHAIYMKPLTTSVVSFKIFLALVLFVAACIAGMVLIYISQLHATLDFTNKEHVKLLNGMHEGVLIFS